MRDLDLTNLLEGKQTLAQGVLACVGKTENESVFTVDEERKPKHARLLGAEPNPLKVNAKLISTAYSGLPGAELFNQTPAERATATFKCGSDLIT